MTAPSAIAVRGQAERELTIPLGLARAAVIRAIGEAGFSLEIDQLTVVQAARGSKFAGASGSADKLPVRLTVRLSAADTGCAVSMELVDQWKLPVRRPVENYRTLIIQVIDAMDAALRRVDPTAPAFSPAQVSGATAGPPTSSGQTLARLSGAANRYLEGGTPTTQRRPGWQETGSVVIATSKASAVFDIEAAYGLVTVGTMVVSRPGDMPRPMVDQLSAVVSTVESALERGGSSRLTVFVELDSSAIPAVEFLAQQSRIREQVAVRTLQVCTTCRLTKVINPDYTKLKAKRHRTNILSNSLGAVIGAGGISPFVLIGRLAQLNQLDLEFVCPRCQGLHAESSLITFCPKCGEQCNESALRACKRCKFEFRSLASTKDLWDDPITPPTAAIPLVPPTQWAPPVPDQRVDTVGATSAASPAAGWSPPAVFARIVTPPNWYPDPQGRHQLRWWDGTAWTADALDNGVATVDSL